MGLCKDGGQIGVDPSDEKDEWQKQDNLMHHEAVIKALSNLASFEVTFPSLRWGFFVLIGIIGTEDDVQEASNAKCVVATRTRSDTFALLETDVPLKRLAFRVMGSDPRAFDNWQCITWDHFALNGVAVGRFEGALQSDVQWLYDYNRDTPGDKIAAANVSFPSADGPGPSDRQGGYICGKAVYTSEV